MKDLPTLADKHLATGRALGAKLEDDGRVLRSFLAFLERTQAAFFTTPLALQWASAPRNAQPAHWVRRIRVVRAFARYASATKRRHRACSPPSRGAQPIEPAFFLSERGTRIVQKTLQRTFVQLSRQVGLRGPTDSHGPRLYDLRHRFAVSTELCWYRDGVDSRAPSAPSRHLHRACSREQHLLVPHGHAATAVGGHPASGAERAEAPRMKLVADLARLLAAFFTDRLMQQRQARMSISGRVPMCTARARDASSAALRFGRTPQRRCGPGSTNSASTRPRPSSRSNVAASSATTAWRTCWRSIWLLPGSPAPRSARSVSHPVSSAT